MSLGHSCWYCFWGWATPVAEIYLESKALLHGDDSALQFGPAHVVWSDENWGTSTIELCLKECENHTDLDPKDLLIVKNSLIRLLEIPEEVRECEPKDYDGINPGNYPPKTDIILKENIR